MVAPGIDIRTFEILQSGDFLLGDREPGLQCFGWFVQAHFGHHFRVSIVVRPPWASLDTAREGPIQGRPIGRILKA